MYVLTKSDVTHVKCCHLCLSQSLRILKASDLKPYVVFIAPPNIEKLRQLRMKQDSTARIQVRYMPALDSY